MIKLRICTAISSLFYLGFIPGAPGTYASIATTLGFLIVYLISHQILPSLHLAAVCLITLVGTFTSHETSRGKGTEDPSFVVIDEVAGQLTALLFLPMNAMNLILAIFAFRLFDIWKPFPLRQAEKLGKGVGIMADDLLAGIYANLALHLINLIL